MSKRVVIIGGGIAGLSAAYLLHQRFSVTVCERSDLLGGNHQQVQKDGDTLNLGASYLPQGDHYAWWFLRRFQATVKPMYPWQAGWVLDRERVFSGTIPWVLFFALLFVLVRLAAKVRPSLDGLLLSDVFARLPRGLRRGAILAIGYDPITHDELDGLLFLPYMRYFLWSCIGTGYLVQWGDLTARRLADHLREQGVSLATRTEVTAVTRAPGGAGYTVRTRDADGAETTLHADQVVVACYPRAAAELLRDVVSPALVARLAGSQMRLGSAIVLPAPALYRRKRLYFLQKRSAEGRTVRGMLDRQFGDRYARVFSMDNTTQQDLLADLGADAASVVAERHTFVHYAPDHTSMYRDLRPLILQHHADPAQDIHFCSYAYDPSGFRNADQSIMTAIRAARRICAREGGPTPNLAEVNQIPLGFWGRLQRRLLHNQL